MKNYISIAFVMLLPACAIAEDLEVSLSLTSVNFDYLETSRGLSVNSEKASYGKVNGIEAMVEYGAISGKNSGFYNSAHASFHIGDTDYVGSLQGGTYGDLKNSTKNMIFDFDYMFGYRKAIIKDLSVGAELGLGYRNWLRQLQGSSGYDEVYQWGYWAAGVNAKYIADERTTIFANYNFMQAVDPKMHAGFNGGLDFDLGNTDGNKYGIGADYRINNGLSIVGKYGFENWNISKSNVVSNYFEPDSKTKNQTIKIGVKKSW